MPKLWEWELLPSWLFGRAAVPRRLLLQSIQPRARKRLSAVPSRFQLHHWLDNALCLRPRHLFGPLTEQDVRNMRSRLVSERAQLDAVPPLPARCLLPCWLGDATAVPGWHELQRERPRFRPRLLASAARVLEPNGQRRASRVPSKRLHVSWSGG